MDVAIRDAMVPEAGTPEFFRGVRELGVSAVEFEVDAALATPRLLAPDGQPHSAADAAGIAALGERLRREGVRASALLLATDFSGADADLYVIRAARATQAAADLGVPVVRIDPLALDKSLGRDVVLERFVRRTRQLLGNLAGATVDIGIENHGPLANDPAFLDAVFAALPDPRLGLTLDTGNFYWFGFPLDELYALIERFAPRVKHTHVKNINYPPALANVRREVGAGYKEHCCSLDEGNIDLRRVVKILRDAGYDRDLCIENESLFKHPPERRADVLRRDVAAVRAAIG